MREKLVLEKVCKRVGDPVKDFQKVCLKILDDTFRSIALVDMRWYKL